MDEYINVPVIPQFIPNAVRQVEAEKARLAKDVNFNVNAKLNNTDIDKNIGRSLGRITGQADEFTKSMNAANARVLAFGASVGTINLIVKAFQGLISSAIEVEDALKKISISGGETFSNVKKVSEGLFAISKYTATSFKDASAAVLEFSRQGKSLEESLKAARAALVLTKNTGLDAAEAVRGLTAVVNVFNQKGLDYETVVNKMAAVDTKFAVSSKDLIEGITRSASVAQEAQVSFEELTAFITVLQEKTGRGGPVIGNSIKTIFTRVQNPEILKDLKNLGILVTDTNQEFLSATQILINLAQGFDKLDANLKKSLLLKIGGGFQVDKLKAIIESLKGIREGGGGTNFEKVFAAASSKDNTEAFRKVEEQSKTLENRFTKLTLAGQQFSDTVARIGFSEELSNKVGMLTSLLEGVNKNVSGGEKTGGTIGKAVVKGLGAALTGPGALLFGGLFIKFTYDFVKFASSALQSLTGVTQKSKEEKSIQESIFGVLTRNKKIQEDLLFLEGDKASQARYIVGLYADAADELERAAKWSKEIAPVAFNSGIRMGSGILTNVNSGTTNQSRAASSAKGYIPNFTSESQAYQNEVANAPAGAKIIRHTNFPLGGGKVAPVMYTNDKETLIPNFKGTGGTAVIPNYRTSSNGFIPNFAEDSERSINKGTLNIDAMNFGIAGLSLGTDAGNPSSRYKGGLIGKTKGKELYQKDGKESNFLKRLKDSPLYEAFKDYSMVQVSNLPVGAVYAFAKNLKDNEEVIKRDFIGRANNQVSGSIANFILSEIKNLGLSVPPQFANALKTNPQGFNLIDSSAAGGLFEKIVQYASLNGRSVASLKGNEKTPFDIYGLNGQDAASFGLPAKNFRYVEVKSSIQELYDGITEKFVNQSKIELAAPKAGSAAGGYIPNFAEDPLKKSITRELKATGLPPSEIKVSKDPRLFSASKNPLGLGVTNTKDEPRGMSDVSSGRIKEAYGSAVLGYIPNFVRVKRSQADKDFKKEMGYWPEEAPAPNAPIKEVDLSELSGSEVEPAIEEPKKKTTTGKGKTPKGNTQPSSTSSRPAGFTNLGDVFNAATAATSGAAATGDTPLTPEQNKAVSEVNNLIADATGKTLGKPEFTEFDRRQVDEANTFIERGGKRFLTEKEISESEPQGYVQDSLSTSEKRDYSKEGNERMGQAREYARGKLTPEESTFKQEFETNDRKGNYNDLNDSDYSKLNDRYRKILNKFDDLVEQFQQDSKQGNLGSSQSGATQTKPEAEASTQDAGSATSSSGATANKKRSTRTKGAASGSTTQASAAAAQSNTTSQEAESKTKKTRDSGKAGGGSGAGAGGGGSGGGGSDNPFSGGPIPVTLVSPIPLDVKIVASSIKFGETISERMIKSVVDSALKSKSKKTEEERTAPDKLFPFEPQPTGLTKKSFMTANQAEKALNKKQKDEEAEAERKRKNQQNIAREIAESQKPTSTRKFAFEPVATGFTKSSFMSAGQAEKKLIKNQKDAEAAAESQRKNQQNVAREIAESQKPTSTRVFSFETPSSGYTEKKLLGANSYEKALTEKQEEDDIKRAKLEAEQAAAQAQQESFAKARTPSLAEADYPEAGNNFRATTTSAQPLSPSKILSDLRFDKSLENTLSLSDIQKQKQVNALLGVNQKTEMPILTAAELPGAVGEVNAKKLEEQKAATERARAAENAPKFEFNPSPSFSELRKQASVPAVSFEDLAGMNAPQVAEGISGPTNFQSAPASSLLNYALGESVPVNSQISSVLNPANVSAAVSQRDQDLFKGLAESTPYVPAPLSGAKPSKAQASTAVYTRNVSGRVGVSQAEAAQAQALIGIPAVGKAKEPLIYEVGKGQTDRRLAALDLSSQYEAAQKIKSKYQKNIDPYAGTSFDDILGITQDKPKQARSKAPASNIDKPLVSSFGMLNNIFSSSPARKLDSPPVRLTQEQIEESMRRSVAPRKSKLELDTSLLTGEGITGSKTVFRGLKPEQIEKLKKEIEFLTTQFQKNGKPMATLQLATETASRRLRDLGINFKPEGLRELATATSKAERQRIEAVANAQRSTPNLTYSIGRPADLPDATSLNSGATIERVFSSIGNKISTSLERAFNFGNRVVSGTIGSFAGQTEEEKQRQQQERNTNKSTVESAAALAKLLSITTALSSAFSVFGERVADLAQAVASAVNAFGILNEGLNSAGQLRGTVDVLDPSGSGAVIGQRSRGWRETFDAAVQAGRQARQGSAGQAGTGLLGFGQATVGFLSGGGLRLLASGAATAAVGITAAIEAFNAIDAVAKFFTDDLEGAADQVATITKLNKDYSLSLSETSRSLMSAMSSIADVKTTGFYGFLNRNNPLRSLRPETFEGETAIQDSLLKLRFASEKAQQEFFNSLSETMLLKADTEIMATLSEEEKKNITPEITKRIRKKGLDLVQEFLNNLLIGAEQKDITSVVAPAAFSPQPLGLQGNGTVSLTGSALSQTGSILNLSSSGGVSSTPSGYNPSSPVLTEAEAAIKREEAFSRLQKERMKEAEGEYNRLKLNQGQLGISKDYLMTQLSIYTKLTEAANNLTTSEEYRLQRLKESSFISEREKDLLDLKLKIIQNEKQGRQEINSIIQNGLNQEITAKLKPKELGITPEEFKKYTDAFKSISVDLPINVDADTLRSTLEEKLSTIFKDTLNLGAVGTPDVLNKIIKESVALLTDQALAQGKITTSKTEQLRIEDENVRKIKAKKYLEDSIRESLDARLTIQQKSLALLREERDLSLNIKENRLRTSLAENYNITPRRSEMILSQAAPDQQKARSESALKARRDENFFSLRKSVIDYTIKNNPNILNNSEAVDKLINTKNKEDLTKALEDAMKFQEDELNKKDDFKPLRDAADHLVKKIDEGIDKLVKNIPDIVRGYKTGTFPEKQDESAARYTKNLGFGQSSATFEDFLKTDESYLSLRIDDPVKLPTVTVSASKPETEAAKKEAARKNRAKLLEQSFSNPEPANIQEDIDVKYRLDKAEARRKNKLTSDFEGGLMSSRIQMNEDIEFFANKMGREIPDSFRDSMASAMKELANPNSTEPLKNRLLAVANSFLQKINDSLMTNLANKITSPITGLFTPEMRASGGMISGGSGNKDDVPAMLMGGEYVVNKKSVSKYGASFFDALNSGKIKKFADGGWVESDVTRYQDPSTITPYGQRRDQGLSFDESGSVIGMDSYTGRNEDKAYALKQAQTNYYAQNQQNGQGGFYVPGENGMGSIMGQRNLLAFSMQQTAGTQFDKISGRGNAASIDIAGGSSNLSLFALRDQENLRNTQYSEAKQKALELYIGGFDAAKEKANIEEEARKEIERIKQEQKTAFRKQYQGMLVQLGISAAMAMGSAALSNMTSSGGQAAQKAKIDSINSGTANSDYSQGYDNKGELYSSKNPATIENTRLTTREKLFGYGREGGFFRGSAFKSGNSMLANDQGIYSWDGGGYTKTKPSDMQWSRMQYGSKPIGIGGQTYYSAATRRASGGFVSGSGSGDNVPTMLNGGEFVISRQAAQNIGANKLQQLNSTSPNANNSDISEVLDAKLSELIDKLNSVGTINITVNSESNGKTKESEDSSNEDSKNREMARRIKDVVLNILKEEKRLGGILR